MAQNPNYTKSIGGLAANFYDFQAHYEGLAFRHLADQIDLDTPIIVNGIEYFNVNTAIDAINNALAEVEITSTIQGVTTVGDGYNTYHAANGTINFDNTIPSLDTLLNPLFASIVAGSPLPGYSRLADGGLLMIKSGTYIVRSTILVPPGITIMGESTFSVKIINATALNTSVSPPVVSGTPAPIFEILSDSSIPFTNFTRQYVDGPVVGSTASGALTAPPADMFSFARQTRICNMIISDNFVEPTILGDSTYTAPQNKTGITTPLIKQDNGSNLSLSNVSILGRVNFSSGTAVSQATTLAILLNTTFAAPNGTLLSIDKCTIDGFSQPIRWESTGDATNNVNRDYLSITNSHIRAFGYLQGDSSTGLNNAIIVTNDNNTMLSNNYFYANTNKIQALLYINSHLAGSAPFVQARSRINIQNNSIVVDRSSGDGSSGINYANIAFKLIFPDSTSFASNPYDLYAVSSLSGNNFQGVLITSGPVFKEPLVITSTASYTVSSNDHVIAVAANSGGTTVNLPYINTSAHPTNIGRELIIKEAGSASALNPLTIQAQSPDSFEIGTSNYSYVITQPYTSITLVGVLRSSGQTAWIIL